MGDDVAAGDAALRYDREVVEATLDELGIAWTEDPHTSWATALCPMHDDTRPSFRVNLEEGGWRCLSGCGQEGDLAFLVQALLGGEIPEIRQRLRAAERKADEDAARRTLARVAPPALAAPAVEPDDEGFAPLELNDPLAYVHGTAPRYILRRGFTVETLRAWDVGTNEAHDAVVVPVHRDGQVVGLVRRLVAPGPRDPKYLNTRFEKKEVLFGEERLPFGIDEVAVVEGPLDAMWLSQHGIPAVATLGGGLSPWQAARLARLAWTLVLAFDRDPGGRAAAESSAWLLRRVRLLTLDLPDDVKDVQELDAERLAAVWAARRAFIPSRAPAVQARAAVS